MDGLCTPLFGHNGSSTGPYWLAVYYSEYLGPVELYLLVLNFFTAVPMIAITILCFTIPQKRYKRLWEKRLKYGLYLPLIALILLPSLITLQPGAALRNQTMASNLLHSLSNATV